MFADKTLLITGGTGSFGTAVLKRFIDEPFDEIRIFSRDEKKQEDQRHRFNDPRLSLLHRRRARLWRGAQRHARGRFHLPRRGAQAGAVLRVPSARGGEDQRSGGGQRHGGGDRQRRLARGLPVHRQGRLSDQRHGHLQGDDGEGHGGQGALGPLAAGPPSAARATAMCWLRAGRSSRSSSARCCAAIRSP